MHKNKVIGLALSAVLALGVLSGCGANSASGEMKDGNYKAEASDFDSHGWKPFVEITVKDKKITDAKYDYVNKDGKFKTQDEEYNKNMKAKSGTDPKTYAPQLAKSLVDKQDPAKVDTVTGATSSSKNFKELAVKVIDEGAKKGAKDTVKVKMPEEKK